MSRIGRMTIKVPDKVKVTAEPGLVKVEGPKGKVQQRLDPAITVKQEKGELHVLRPDDSTRTTPGPLSGVSSSAAAKWGKPAIKLL